MTERQHDRRSHDLMGKTMGEIVQALYGVTDEELTEALKIQDSTNARLGDILVDNGTITEEQLMACVAVLVRKESTFLSHAFLAPLHRRWWGRHSQLAVEGLLFSFLSMGTVFALGIEESGLISLFLVTAALTTRFNVVMADKNKRKEATDILALFSGIFGAYVTVALSLNPETFVDMFGFVVRVADIQLESTIMTRNFSNFPGILYHNFLVMISVFILVFIYRSYAVMLTLSWNACIWGLTLTMLLQRTFSFTDLNLVTYILVAVAALLPHLTMEAFAYIFCALTSVGLSKSYLWHGVASAQFYVDLQRRALGIAMAFGCLVVGAILEATWAPYILSVYGLGAP